MKSKSESTAWARWRQSLPRKAALLFPTLRRSNQHPHVGPHPEVMSMFSFTLMGFQSSMICCFLVISFNYDKVVKKNLQWLLNAQYWKDLVTTVDARQFVQVMVPVRHAQQTQARCGTSSPPPRCTISRHLHDLAQGKGMTSLLRSLCGQVKQLQTNNPWQRTCRTRLAHSLPPFIIPQ